MIQKKSIPEILQQLVDQNTEKVKLAITDIDGILRGKIMSFDKFRSVAESGFGFCDVVFGWDAADQAYDNASFTGWHTGYPDAKATVDLQTFRQIPWENDIPVFLADFKDGKKAALPVCPRSLLKKINEQAIKAGFNSSFSQEFEWFNFINNSEELYNSKFSALQPMTRGMFGYSVLRASQNSDFFHAIFDGMTKFNVPIEGLHTETGPGVYEAAILYADILEAADRAVLFKAGVKEIAHRHGYIASFMAKVNEQLPGCSGHVHQSLWSTDGKQNLFYDKKKTSGMSAVMESYIAGQLYCLPHILPMFAPTVNSYKRLVEGAWAPTTITWAVDNRTTALRALPGSASSTRLETRVVGSDSNPYLAMAGCLAAGLYGIQQKMKLTIPATTGSGYANKKNGVLPANLWEASQAMKQSAVAKELFGAAFVEHFTATREWEWRQFSKKVTDWELQRYLEII
ncbi:glutamine synthetase family protein [Flavihumibacter profundi]|uniref:glutamine synthetase family protein n=1 Tax=Flavihumibacter profundi TaxID=2716883 RepID=UPI001CC3B8F1|nr:glutamine synthetase family protein [Flavihumibacter profundi]MBZ5859295.1 glutamine synthetase family protein [Flavihumibacter profundi]